MSALEAHGSAEDVYETLEKYNWDDDVEFQSGLSAILGTNSTPEQAAELTLRARCFYYARKYNVNIDFDAYRAYHNARPAQEAIATDSRATSSLPTTSESASGVLPTPATSNEPQAPYSPSFAHIVELLTTGQPIPGIKEIPDTVLSGQGTQPSKPKRKKPWEKDEAVADTSGEKVATV